MVQIGVPEDTSTNPLIYRFVATILDLYILMTIIPYTFMSISLAYRLNSRVYTKRRLSTKDRYRLQNFFIGWQITMVLWILGLLLGIDDLFIRIVYYFAALAKRMYRTG